MSEKFTEFPNKKTAEKVENEKGRKLTVKNSTFNLDDSSYKGTITDAFWYKTAENKDRVMLVIQLDDGTEFKNSIDGDWIEKYPFSRLISQANVEYVEDFVNLKVKFDVCNKKGNTVTFTNIKKICLDE